MKFLIVLVFDICFRTVFSTKLFCRIKSNERSEYSYTGLADFFLFFFQEKVSKFVHAKFWFFVVWLVVSFKFSAFPLLKGRQTPLSNSKSVKVTKNVIHFWFRKWKLIIRFHGEIKVLRIDPVFSNWVNFSLKMSIINCSTNSKSFRHLFFSSKFKRLLK